MGLLRSKYSWGEMGRLCEEYGYKREVVSVTGLPEAEACWFKVDWLRQEKVWRETSEEDYDYGDGMKKTSGQSLNKMEWCDQRDLESSGLSLKQAPLEAPDRDRCKNIVQASCDPNAAGS